MTKSERRPRKRRTVSRLPADVKRAVEAALEKKALDLIVLDLRRGPAFTDFFVICTGTNIRHVQAIADAIDDLLRQQGLKPALVEGYERAGWVLMDYFDFIIHIFAPATRDFYALERLWGEVPAREIGARAAAG